MAGDLSIPSNMGELGEDLKAIANKRWKQQEGYRTKTEARYAEFGWRLTEEHLGKKVSIVLYEWMTLLIPGASYTPDFLLILDTGELVFVECKHNKRQPHYRTSRLRMRICASISPFFTFVMATEENNWEMETIKPTKGLVTHILRRLLGGHHED